MADGPSLRVVVKDTQGKAVFPDNSLIVTDFRGSEGLAQLYGYELFLTPAKNTPLPFEKILGQQVTVTLEIEKNKKRFFSGICNTIAEGLFSGASFRATIAPMFWLLTRKVRSRVFDHKSVPDILEKILGEVQGLDVSTQLLDRSKYPAHDFCTQYRESDFNFACRLMEEEGIYYFFDQLEQGTIMVLADASAGAHVDIKTKLLFGPGRTTSFVAEPNRLFEWEKAQQLRSSTYKLIDHHFEHPTSISESKQAVPALTVKAGAVAHKLKILGDDFFISDFPGEYAHRFDDIAIAGGANAKGLDQIPGDKDRTAKIRIEQETVSGLLIRGTSTCSAFAAGKTFEITDNQAANGKYMLVSVNHGITQGSDITGQGNFSYQNGFTAIPFDRNLPFRPMRVTPRPFIAGTQTAIVVGFDKKKSPDQEILTDKFGRVKVQFHWDRENDPDADCSCWVRVGQMVAGKRWGASFWPRVGQEVIVAFLEGNPDQPIIIGSVYNAVQMPPYLGAGLDSKHAEDNKISGIKSNTTLGGEGFNEWRFDDNKGKEQIFFHAERNMDTRVKNDSIESVINDRSLIVGAEKDGKKSGDQKEKVFKDKHLHVMGNQEEHIGGNFKLMIGHGDGEGGNVDIVIEKLKKELVEGSSLLHIKKNQLNVVDGFLTSEVKKGQAEKIGADFHLQVAKGVAKKVGGDQSLNVGGKLQQKVGTVHAVDAGQEIHLKAGQSIIIEAGTQISLVVGGNFIDIGPAGISIVGTMVNINSGGSAGVGSGCTPEAPTDLELPPDAEQAAPVEPAIADDSKSGQKSAPG